MTKTEPRSAGSGGGRDKTQPTPTELLACPFCGELPEVQPWHGGGPRKRMIHCTNDDCAVGPSVTGSTISRAYANWNTRTGMGAADVISLARLALNAADPLLDSVYEQLESGDGSKYMLERWNVAKAGVRTGLGATTLSAREDGWQPIETAPEGVRVLIACGDVVGEALLHENGEWWWANNHPTDSWGMAVYPDAFQPLPKAPTAGEGS